MVYLFRKHQQTLMVIITAIVIISFVWLYDPTYRRGGRPGADFIGSVYDRRISLSEFQRGTRKVEVCAGLDLSELLSTLATDGRTRDEQLSNFVFNNIILRHESDELGLVPTGDEVIAAIKVLPRFQTNGAYDSNKFNEFVQRIASFGFTGQQIEESVGDDLRLKKLKDLLGTTVVAPLSEVRAQFEKSHQMTEVSFVKLSDEEIAKATTISDDDVKKAFDERAKDPASAMKTEEMRKVKAVTFLLTDEQKKLPGKERGAALQKLVDRASEFTIAITEKDAKFDEVAQKSGVTVVETPEFDAEDAPKELGEAAEVAQVAFTKLTMEQPNSEVIRTQTGYYVIQLTGITPARPMTFDEAKPKLAEQLKSERVAEAAGLKATEVRNKIDAELKAGKTFAEAATAAGVTPEQLPPFSLVEHSKLDASALQFVGRSLQLEVGQLSEVAPISGGRVIMRVEKRQPVDDAAFEKDKPKLVDGASRVLRDSAFEVWLAERRKLANIKTSVKFGG